MKEDVAHIAALLAETKRERFVRIGVRRMERVLTAIRLLGNLASPHYEFNKSDVEAIRKAIDAQLHKTFLKFEGKKDARKVHFHLRK